ncbi:MAG: hypothetical protein ACMG6S_04635 [Byssovorax sp.]
MFPKAFTRSFSVWRYVIGHGQLLLRSPKTEELSTRVDVGFKNVKYVQLPTLMTTLAIRDGSPGDLPEDLRNVVDLSSKHVYVLDVGGVKGLVVAGYAAWGEDDGEYYQPSTVLPSIMEVC